MYKLDIAYIYPDLLKNDGDISNIIVFKNRCNWRNIDVEITRINPNDEINPNRYDFYFISGEEDDNQIVALNYLKQQANNLKTAMNNGAVFLAMKGGFQLLGSHMIYGQKKLDCLKLLNIFTEIKSIRTEKNVNLKVNFLDSKLKTITGYQNHRGITYLDEDLSPFSWHNNKKSGIVYKNLYGTYLQGDLLALNSHFADHLISLCLKRKYGDVGMPLLNDKLELKVYKEAINKG